MVNLRCIKIVDMGTDSNARGGIKKNSYKATFTKEGGRLESTATIEYDADYYVPVHPFIVGRNYTIQDIYK